MASGSTLKQNIRQVLCKIKFSDLTGMGDYLPYTLQEGMVLSQSFTVQQPGLSELLFSFASTEALTGHEDIRLDIEVREPDQGKAVLVSTLHSSQINVFTRTVIAVPAGLLHCGREYQLLLKVNRLRAGQPLNIHVVPQTDHELRINSKPSGMALALVHAYNRLNTLPLLVALLMLGLAFSLFTFPFPFIGQLFSSLPLLPLLLAPAGTLLVVELLNTLNERFFLRNRVYLVSYLMLFLFQGLWLAITGLPQAAVLITLILFTLLSIANHLKQFFRGDPLYAADIAAFGMVMKTGGHLVYEVQIRFVLSFLSVAVFIGVFQHMNNPALVFWQRLGWLALALGGGILLTWLALFNTRIARRKLGVGNHPWNPMADYRRCGFIVPFSRSVRELFIRSPKKAARLDRSFYELPADTTAEDPAQIASAALEQAANKPDDVPAKVRPAEPSAEKHPAASPAKPNIIVIMSESFCDFRNIRPFKVSEPVLPFFDSLRQRDEVISGNLLVPIFGGGTSNTEFEYLTGSSMYFLSDASVPYLHFFRKPVHGLPDLLRQQGYRCLAVHPYDPTFYNRNTVYPMMGFEQFISMADFPDDQKLNLFIRDSADFNMILNQLEKKEADERLFIFSVTMQNHFPYNGTESNQTDLNYHIKLPEMTDAEGVELFLSLLRESDDALKDFLDKLGNLSEPTLLVFFGDHLPGNNRSFNSFYSSLFGRPLASLGFEDTCRLYETPYLIWANYPLPACDKPLISSNFLGLLTLQLAGAASSPYYRFLAEMHQSIQAIGSQFVTTRQGSFGADQMPDELTQLLNRYWYCQYDNIIKTSNKPWHMQQAELGQAIRQAAKTRLPDKHA